MKKSKFVLDWFLTLTPDGIYSLTFNMKERWIPYHQYSDDLYLFGEEPDNETTEEWNTRLESIPNFLPILEGGHYISSSLQNKDQITFYFIPYMHSWIKNGEIKIIERREK